MDTWHNHTHVQRGRRGQRRRSTAPPRECPATAHGSQRQTVVASTFRTDFFRNETAHTGYDLSTARKLLVL